MRGGGAWCVVEGVTAVTAGITAIGGGGGVWVRGGGGGAWARVTVVVRGQGGDSGDGAAGGHCQ